MSADEGASWAAASASSAGEVLRLHQRLNPADIGLPDLVLHGWIAVCGESLAAMRALSAMLGTFAIVLVFILTRELQGVERGDSANRDEAAESSEDPRGRESGRPPSAEFSSQRELIGATAALIFAVNLVTIKYSRQTRMYPLMLLAVLAQFAYFIRAARRGGWRNYAGVTIFTAISLAAHPSALFAFTAEALWVVYRLWRERADFRQAIRWVCKLAGAVVLGLALLAPALPTLIGATAHAAAHGALNWITRPPWWEPIALFNKGTGSFGFPVLALLAIAGAIGAWRGAAARFCLLWMWAPPTIVLLFSYLVRPAFVERYLLSSFVPFFILAAFGVWEIPNLWARWWKRRAVGRARNLVRAGTLALALVLAVAHVAAYRRKPHGPEWREAARLAARPPGENIAVAPGYAVDVVEYYLRRNGDGARPQRALPADPAAPVLILADEGVPPEAARRLAREYPRVMARPRGLVIRHR
ncbi:MAG: glycosyltransferase family 39 protein [Candidatus Binataceae bacterium]